MIWYARQAFIYARHRGLESNRSSHQNRSFLRRKKSVCRFKNTSFIIVFCLNCVCQNDFLIQSKYQRRNSLHMLCSDIRRFNESILTVTPTYPKSTSFTYFINHIFVLSYSWETVLLIILFKVIIFLWIRVIGFFWANIGIDKR